eukprot:scaffold4081_cov268-Pinguiococcus_pyrenoidosus.AAC.11
MPNGHVQLPPGFQVALVVPDLPQQHDGSAKVQDDPRRTRNAPFNLVRIQARHVQRDAITLVGGLDGFLEDLQATDSPRLSEVHNFNLVTRCDAPLEDGPGEDGPATAEAEAMVNRVQEREVVMPIGHVHRSAQGVKELLDPDGLKGGDCFACLPHLSLRLLAFSRPSRSIILRLRRRRSHRRSCLSRLLLLHAPAHSRWRRSRGDDRCAREARLLQRLQDDGPRPFHRGGAGVFRQDIHLVERHHQVLAADLGDNQALRRLRLEAFRHVHHQNGYVDDAGAADDRADEVRMAGTVHQRAPQRARVAASSTRAQLERIGHGQSEGGEAQIQRNAATFALWRLVERSRTQRGAQRRHQRRLPGVHVTQHTHIHVEQARLCQRVRRNRHGDCGANGADVYGGEGARGATPACVGLGRSSTRQTRWRMDFWVPFQIGSDA